MPILRALGAALALIGRHGTLFVAASIFVGLFVPGVAALCRPYLGEAIIVMLTLAFLRVDPDELLHHWTRPRLIIAASAWLMLLLPAVTCSFFLLVGLKSRLPDLFLILVLQMSAPGLMSSPALAGLIGLDVALTLLTLIVGIAVTPLVASAMTHVFLGAVVISPLELGFKLFLVIAGSALAAAVIRWIAGARWIEAQRERMDGLSVIAMFMFAAAAMDGITDHFRAQPLLVTELTALAFALSLGLIALTTLVFLRVGRARALSIGLIAGYRNMGLMLTAMGFMVPDIAWLYFGLGQFPIYLLPHLMKPLARRFAANP